MELNNVKKAIEPEVSVNDVSRISSLTVIKGEVSSVNDIRVDGKVDGKLYSKGKIVVGQMADLKGCLLCNNVDFWGKMKGDIYVRDLLTLKSSSVIDGSINVNKLQVEMGAQINGTCHMINDAEYEKSVESLVTTKIPEQKAPEQKSK
ncbi:MAG: polymer-forming cytoskeletal protein [Bacteroidales bacterium]|nr:polymer-forming cytoskeletal protein [Candidatus Cryptobacteroides aphodequi]